MRIVVYSNNRSHAKPVFAHLLFGLSSREFLDNFRTTRNKFHEMLLMIEGNFVFTSPAGSRKIQEPVAHQLMVFLYYILD